MNPKDHMNEQVCICGHKKNRHYGNFGVCQVDNVSRDHSCQQYTPSIQDKPAKSVNIDGSGLYEVEVGDAPIKITNTGNRPIAIRPTPSLPSKPVDTAAREKYVMKGNEKDCICAKLNGKHEKQCDAYRLSQFSIRAASILASKPTSSPTESWLNEKAERLSVLTDLQALIRTIEKAARRAQIKEIVLELNNTPCGKHQCITARSFLNLIQAKLDKLTNE